jgi:hypothetical protein
MNDLTRIVQSFLIVTTRNLIKIKATAMTAPAGHPGELIDTFNYGNWRTERKEILPLI